MALNFFFWNLMFRNWTFYVKCSEQRLIAVGQNYDYEDLLSIFFGWSSDSVTSCSRAVLCNRINQVENYVFRSWRMKQVKFPKICLKTEEGGQFLKQQPILSNIWILFCYYLQIFQKATPLCSLRNKNTHQVRRFAPTARPAPRIPLLISLGSSTESRYLYLTPSHPQFCVLAFCLSIF